MNTVTFLKSICNPCDVCFQGLLNVSLGSVALHEPNVCIKELNAIFPTVVRKKD